MDKHYIDNGRSTLFAIFYLVIFIGISLAVYQFMFNRSLWIDEAMLALNIINRGFSGLTEPLYYKQVAPVGFLFIERISILMLGKNEFALRIFPLISFLVSIPLFYLLGGKLTGNKMVALLSTSIFSITLSLLRYSSEVKQYSSDVLFTLILLYCCLTLKLNTNRSLLIYAVIGGIAIWFSNIAVIILFVAGMYSLYYEFYKNKHFKIVVPLLFWAVSFFIYYIFFIHNHPHTEFMIDYWKEAFLPLSPFSASFYLFLFRVAQDIYSYLLGFGFLWFMPFLISVSAAGFMLKRREYTVLYFFLAPIAVHLFLSGLMLYPFKGRFLLYSIPLIILIFSIGLYELFEFTNKRILKLPQFLLILPVLVMFYPIYTKFPIQIHEVKHSLNYMETNIKSDETIYVYCNSRPAFKFYK
ncbi:MAG: glycosyltransferase family 39 protein, partial [Acidobacteria bacterium]|nr:glycosyltransferase family 39 protein [Acidobacteriota bacterium]